MRLERPPSLPVWVWLILLVWGPSVAWAAAASGYSRSLDFRAAAPIAALLSALAYLSALALRRLLTGAAAMAGQRYVVRHAGLAFGATLGAMQVAGKVPTFGDVPLAEFGAAVLLNATIGAPFALWAGVFWQAGMRWFLRSNPRDRD